MFTFLESKEKPVTGTAAEDSLDPQLWHACAGTTVQLPPPNSAVFYFPQGHLEHASGDVNLPNYPCYPPYIPCTVVSVRYEADPETDEAFAWVNLRPYSGDPASFGHDAAPVAASPPESGHRPFSIKTLTQSDANNGGGFSVPRYCAETVFPRLDLATEPPAQNITARDVHGRIWTFRHIYRGTPRRHLLTTGWSAFVNQKRLVAGDSVVFSRSPDGGGELRVGIRRAKRSGRSRVEDVMEAMGRAARGEAFDVAYYPRAGRPEFMVRAGLVRVAMGVRWAEGIRFKMAFETEDLTRTSWFVGTVVAVRAIDPSRWPDSPWRLLQVKWDEANQLDDVKRVNPWLVELVPTFDLSPFSPPLKRLKLLHNLDLESQLYVPAFNNPLGFVRDNNNNNNNNNNAPPPAGMQGARHARSTFTPSTHSSHAGPDRSGSNPQPNGSKTFDFVLFGKKILIGEEQILTGCSSGTPSLSDGNVDKSLE